jgi:hypothetical protein
MTTRVHFGNLDTSIDQRQLEDECRRFGSVANVWVARNPPGFAFVVRRLASLVVQPESFARPPAPASAGVQRASRR